MFFLLCGLVACSQPTYQERDDYTIVLDGHLPQSPDGLYRLVLDRSKFQTVHRISGSMLDADGRPPAQEQRITWESSHVWTFEPGDTIITIYRRNVDMTGHWVVIDTATIRAPTTLIVPTVNPASYTTATGEFNNMIGPVLSMLGDTMTIRAMWTSRWYTTDTIRAAVRFVLE